MIFTCEKCNFVAKTSRDYNRHVLTKKHQLRINDDAKYKCLCGKTYKSVQCLYRHRRQCNPIRKNETIENTSENQTLRKENQEIREEINELKSKVTKLEGKSTNNFTIVQQGRRKVNKNIRNELIIKQDNKCNDCNNVLSLYYQVDHITALQYGGNDEFDNLQALCCECHAKKSSIENVVRDKIRNAIVDIIKTESPRNERIRTASFSGVSGFYSNNQNNRDTKIKGTKEKPG